VHPSSGTAVRVAARGWSKWFSEIVPVVPEPASPLTMYLLDDGNAGRDAESLHLEIRKDEGNACALFA
jgi:hypothetical protein